jgi:hypothetical protein
LYRAGSLGSLWSVRSVFSRSRRGFAGVALLVWACGASNVPAPAAAQPRRPGPASLRSPATLGAPRRPGAIGAANVTRVKKLWEVAAGGRGRAVAVSRKLQRVAFSSGSPIRLYAFHSGKQVGSTATCPDVIRGGLGFVDDKLLVVCESDVRLYERGKPSAPTVKVSSAKITAAAIAWPRLALGHHDGVVRVYGLDGSPTVEIPVPGPPIDVKSLALTQDGTRVAVAWVQGSIWWWELSNPQSYHKLVRHERESDTVAFSSDGSLLAEEGRSFFTTVWEFGASPAERAQIRNGSWVKRILFTRDSKWLVRGGSDGLELAEIDGPRRVALDTRGSVEDVAVDEYASALAAVDRDGRLTFWAPR